MQPHPPQLPHEDAQRPVPVNLKKGALWFLLALVVVAALLAFWLPTKQAKDRSQLPPPAHRTQSPAYDHPTQQ
jgi:hypothetical protein